MVPKGHKVHFFEIEVQLPVHECLSHLDVHLQWHGVGPTVALSVCAAKIRLAYAYGVEIISVLRAHFASYTTRIMSPR